jgi:hypothetical protein
MKCITEEHFTSIDLAAFKRRVEVSLAVLDFVRTVGALKLPRPAEFDLIGELTEPVCRADVTANVMAFLAAGGSLEAFADDTAKIGRAVSC